MPVLDTSHVEVVAARLRAVSRLFLFWAENLVTDRAVSFDSLPSGLEHVAKVRRDAD